MTKRREARRHNFALYWPPWGIVPHATGIITRLRFWSRLLCALHQRRPGPAPRAAVTGNHRQGQGADGSRRLRKLPYRRSLKTVRRRQADRYAVRRRLFRQPDAGPQYRDRPLDRRRVPARHALRRRPDGAHYYPAFPYPHFTKMVRDDVFAIRAYLNTLAPVNNTPPPSELPWPLNYRALMRPWNFAVLPAGHLRARPEQERRMESRRLSGRRHRSLRRVPHAEERPRRGKAKQRGSPAAGSMAGLRRASTAPSAAA